MAPLLQESAEGNLALPKSSEKKDTKRLRISSNRSLFVCHCFVIVGKDCQEDIEVDVEKER